MTHIYMDIDMLPHPLLSVASLMHSKKRPASFLQPALPHLTHCSFKPTSVHSRPVLPKSSRCHFRTQSLNAPSLLSFHELNFSCCIAMDTGSAPTSQGLLPGKPKIATAGFDWRSYEYLSFIVLFCGQHFVSCQSLRFCPLNYFNFKPLNLRNYLKPLQWSVFNHSNLLISTFILRGKR